MKRWKLVLLPAVVGALITVGVMLLFFDFSKKWVVRNVWVGLREEEIRKRYGEPASDENGYQSVGLYQPSSMPKGPIRTLSYRIEGARLTFWLEQRGDYWGCFESLFVRDGIEF
jgi:hypothetical protein